MGATRRAKIRLLRLAYILGKISPQRSMTKVRIPTSKMALTHSFIPPKRKSPKGSKTKTIDKLTKLLAISKVANSFCGRLSSCTMSELLSCCSSSSTSVEDSENKAVSDPDIRAEQAKSSIKISALMSKSTVEGVNDWSIDDSVSKIKCLVIQ